jgi:hypothetical protein
VKGCLLCLKFCHKAVRCFLHLWIVDLLLKTQVTRNGLFEFFAIFTHGIPASGQAGARTLSVTEIADVRSMMVTI